MKWIKFIYVILHEDDILGDREKRSRHMPLPTTPVPSFGCNK